VEEKNGINNRFNSPESSLKNLVLSEGNTKRNEAGELLTKNGNWKRPQLPRNTVAICLIFLSPPDERRGGRKGRGE